MKKILMLFVGILAANCSPLYSMDTEHYEPKHAFRLRELIDAIGEGRQHYVKMFVDEKSKLPTTKYDIYMLLNQISLLRMDLLTMQLQNMEKEQAREAQQASTSAK